MNPKLIKFLENLQKATEGGAVQPEELIKVSDAILAIVRDTKNQLSEKITKLQDSIDLDILSLKNDFNTKEGKIIGNIKEITLKQEKNIEKKYKKLSEKIKELVDLIPEGVNLTEVEERIDRIDLQLGDKANLIDINNKLNVLEGNIPKISEIKEIIDEKIKGLSKLQKKGGVGTKSLRSLILDVLITGDQTNGQALVWDSILQKWTPGSSGGVSVETPVGDVDGSNNIFTVSNEPKWIIADGITYFEGAGYSYSSGTLTLDTKPVSFIRSIY